MAALSPKEQLLISVLSDETQSQRSLARASGFSLGMTNLLLKRLVGKGYIKVVNLNGRTLRYILTPRGFSEKLHRSYNYLIASIRNLNLLRDRVRNIVLERIRDGQGVYLIGQNELATLARETLKEAGFEARIISGDQALSGEFALEGSLCLQCDMEFRTDLAGREAEVVELASLIEAAKD